MLLQSVECRDGYGVDYVWLTTFALLWLLLFCFHVLSRGLDSLRDCGKVSRRDGGKVSR